MLYSKKIGYLHLFYSNIIVLFTENYGKQMFKIVLFIVNHGKQMLKDIWSE